VKNVEKALGALLGSDYTGQIEGIIYKLLTKIDDLEAQIEKINADRKVVNSWTGILQKLTLPILSSVVTGVIMYLLLG
jgi:fructose-specific phosphotransferase system IIC component